MKWIKTLVLVMALFMAGYWIGYKVGFHDRPPLSAKDVLLPQLSLDAGNYNALKDGKTGLVEDNLRACVWGEIKAYDLYKKEDPTFNTNNESLKSWVEKARVIAQEEEKDMQTNSVPVEVK
jgi:hypothetical protein